jgi:two-component system, chemotaxis family, chemotaxis protein CheY
MAVNYNMTILVVEDHLTIRKMLVNILRQQGFTAFLQADNGKAAWKILEEVPVDLVIADWSMPVMDGMELLLNIRQKQETKEIPVIMITAKAQEKDVLEAIERGANNYIVKPFSPEIVRQKIFAIFNKG